MNTNVMYTTEGGKDDLKQIINWPIILRLYLIFLLVLKLLGPLQGYYFIIRITNRKEESIVMIYSIHMQDAIILVNYDIHNLIFLPIKGKKKSFTDQVNRTRGM